MKWRGKTENLSRKRKWFLFGSTLIYEWSNFELWDKFDPTRIFFGIKMIFSVSWIKALILGRDPVSKLWYKAAIEIYYLYTTYYPVCRWKKIRCRKPSRQDWKYHGQLGKVGKILNWYLRNQYKCCEELNGYRKLSIISTAVFRK